MQLGKIGTDFSCDTQEDVRWGKSTDLPAEGRCASSCRTASGPRKIENIGRIRPIVSASVLAPALIIAACGGSSPGATAAPRYATDKTFHITQLSEVRTDAGSCLAVALDYTTPAKQDVLMTGLGLVPAKGRVSFLSCSDRLDLVAPSDGALIASLRFSNATQFMGDDLIPIPKPTEFGEGFQRGQWRRKGDATFATRAIDILQREFDLVYPVTQGTDSRIVTAYKENNDERTSRAAVMVGYASAAADPVEFRVWVKAQERRARTDWRDPTSEEAKKSALATMSRVRQLMAEGP
jgi:hypothetical protein